MEASINQIANALESAKNMTMEAAAVASSKMGETSYRQYSSGIDSNQLRVLLNSKYVREVKDGMKRVIHAIATGDDSLDVRSFFADVIKNIVNEDFKVRTMVCIYLARYAEHEPDLALLPVNSIQKYVNDLDPRARSLAIKSLSDMSIPSLYPIVLHTLKKSVADVSPIVRNEVCYALIKLHRQNSKLFHDEILTLLEILMSDSDTQVISSAITLFSLCYSENLELLHGHFRHYCDVLPQLDQWSQVYFLKLSIKYCKQYLPKPSLTSELRNFEQIQDKRETAETSIQEQSSVVYDKDLELLIKATKQLIFNSNPCVIVTAFSVMWQLSSPADLKNSGFVEALIRALLVSDTIGEQIYIMNFMLAISSKDANILASQYSKFYIHESDSVQVSCLKLQLISLLLNTENVDNIMNEIILTISNRPENVVIENALAVLSCCGQLSEVSEKKVMKWLINHLEPNFLSFHILGNIINIICLLVQNNPKRHFKSILKLSTILTTQHELADNARAAIVWLFGEIANVDFRICPDVLRQLVSTFSIEGVETRSQILLFSAKVLSYDIDKNKASGTVAYNFEKSRIFQLYSAIVQLAKLDENFDIRDRARFITSIFESNKYEIATLMFQTPKQTSCVATSSTQIISEFSSDSLHIQDTIYSSFTKSIPWNENIEVDESVREPLPLKDYTKFKKSFSSNDYHQSRSTPFRTEEAVTENNVATSSPSSFTTSQGKKYRLQSLDEFFSEVPDKPRRRVIVQEEYSSSDEYTDEESSEDEETSSPNASIM